MSANLEPTAHRPWPMIEGRWVMAQIWHELLFAHWPVPAEILRAHIPARLEIDTFDGQAWLGVVPFRMSGIRLRGTPALPWLSAFPELNVRTYVVADGKPGVWFFSLDAGNAIAVAIARWWFHLPYFRARMSCEARDGWIEYGSDRVHRGAACGELRGRYRPFGDEFLAKLGTLEHFLTERYCLYAIDGQGRISRGEIHHRPWALHLAEAELIKNTIAEAAGFDLPEEKPLLHFAKRQEVVVWRPQRLTG
ncbi:MAG TPA: DUF2071 domain-containing protein [Candidatus Solibacter sp.]|nr:DUF2071 domain-containing protein [Candidatus Solibacter sp.]